MEVDAVAFPPQRTAEISCPCMYAQVDLCMVMKTPASGTTAGQQHAAVSSPEAFASIVRSATRALFGTAGATALECTVVGLIDVHDGGHNGPNTARSAAVVRVPKENFGKLMAACAALSSFDGYPCFLSISSASPFLSNASRRPSLAAECLKQLEGSAPQ